MDEFQIFFKNTLKKAMKKLYTKFGWPTMTGRCWNRVQTLGSLALVEAEEAAETIYGSKSQIWQVHNFGTNANFAMRKTACCPAFWDSFNVLNKVSFTPEFSVGDSRIGSRYTIFCMGKWSSKILELKPWCSRVFLVLQLSSNCKKSQHLTVRWLYWTPWGLIMENLTFLRSFLKGGRVVASAWNVCRLPTLKCW